MRPCRKFKSWRKLDWICSKRLRLKYDCLFCRLPVGVPMIRLPPTAKLLVPVGDRFCPPRPLVPLWPPAGETWRLFPLTDLLLSAIYEFLPFFHSFRSLPYNSMAP
mmetsp:Transcript_2194/g.2885  ORF Transcript_2194/g.2885 Transcript_2194/m.2885 type:complete len:106 (+) Transcript_2194:183-500(+)